MELILYFLVALAGVVLGFLATFLIALIAVKVHDRRMRRRMDG